MSSLAVFLVAIGVADICRRLCALRWLALAAGPVSVLIGAALCGLWHLGDVVLLAAAAVTVVGWVLLCARAERGGAGQDRGGQNDAGQIAPLVLFGLTVAVLGVLSGWPSPVGGIVGRWLPWVGLADVDPTHAVLVVGAISLQLVTGNQLVRLVLTAVGAVRPAGEPQPSDRLKGGRLLGPMERLLIVGLGLGGQLAAASAVIAAKSIIRFPELSAQRKDDGAKSQGSGIDEVTEYFLVGSFASWIVAMAGLALTQAV